MPQDDPSWSKPPKVHIYVDFRFNIWQIANVDTVAGTADVKVGCQYVDSQPLCFSSSEQQLTVSFIQNVRVAKTYPISKLFFASGGSPWLDF